MKEWHETSHKDWVTLYSTTSHTDNYKTSASFRKQALVIPEASLPRTDIMAEFATRWKNTCRRKQGREKERVIKQDWTRVNLTEIKGCRAVSQLSGDSEKRTAECMIGM